MPGPRSEISTASSQLRLAALSSVSRVMYMHMSSSTAMEDLLRMRYSNAFLRAHVFVESTLRMPASGRILHLGAEHGMNCALRHLTQHAVRSDTYRPSPNTRTDTCHDQAALDETGQPQCCWQVRSSRKERRSERAVNSRIHNCPLQCTAVACTWKYVIGPSYASRRRVTAAVYVSCRPNPPGLELVGAFTLVSSEVFVLGCSGRFTEVTFLFRRHRYHVGCDLLLDLGVFVP